MRGMTLVIAVLMMGGISSAARASDAFEVTVRDTDAGGRILIDLSYPTLGGDRKPEIDVTANGRVVDFDWAGEGYGGGTSTRSILVNAAGFGMQTIEVTLRVAGDTMHKVVREIFAPRPVILPGWVDDALVLDPPGLRLEYRFLTIDTVLVNGEPADFGIEKMMPRDGVTYSGVILLDTARPGTNRVEIAAVDWKGETFAFESRFVYAPDGVLRAGQVFSIHYGEVGSRSGPFYKSVVSNAILERISGAMRPDGRIVETWRAMQPGTTTLTFFKKAHFLEEYEAEGTIELRVVR